LKNICCNHLIDYEIRLPDFTFHASVYWRAVINTLYRVCLRNLSHSDTQVVVKQRIATAFDLGISDAVNRTLRNTYSRVNEIELLALSNFAEEHAAC
jgi:hypothetical protein